MGIGIFAILTFINVSMGDDYLKYVRSIQVQGNIPSEIEVYNHYAYWDDGTYIHIFDISNPKTPTELGICKVGSRIFGIVLSYPYIYLTCESDCDLKVMDVSNSFNPTVIGSCKVCPRGLGNIAIEDSLIYGTDYHGKSLRIMNISDPYFPKEVGVCRTPNLARGIAVYSSYAYVGALWDGVRIIDVSDPTNPFEVNYILFPDQGVEKIVVSYPYLYVILYTLYGKEEKDKLYILDISNPTNPKILSHFLKEAENIWDVEPFGNYLYISGDSLWIFDISDPENPVEKGAYWPGWQGSAISDSLLLLSGWFAYYWPSIPPAIWSAFQVADISNPEEPEMITQYTTGSGLLIAKVKGHLLGTCRWIESTGFQLFDIENPKFPKHLGFISSKALYNGLALSDSYAYVCYENRLGGDSGGIYIIDISSPPHLKIVGSYYGHGVPQDVEVSGSYAYLAASSCYLPEGSLGLRVLDISNPQSPSLIGYYKGNYRSLALSYPYLYMAKRYNYGIDIFDVSDPENPQKIGAYTKGDIKDLETDGSYVYIIDTSDGTRAFRILDVSDPSDIREVDHYTFQPQELPTGLTMDGNYAYVTIRWYEKDREKYNALYGFDISNPHNFKKIGYSRLPHCSFLAYHLRPATSKGWIYVPNYTALEICQNTLVAGEEERISIPKTSFLQIYPNPSKSFFINYTLSTSGRVCLRIFDVSGRIVRTLLDKNQNRGSYTIFWDGRDDKNRDLPSGIYFCELKTPKFSDTRKILILRFVGIHS